MEAAGIEPAATEIGERIRLATTVCGRPMSELLVGTLVFYPDQSFDAGPFFEETARDKERTPFAGCVRRELLQTGAVTAIAATRAEVSFRQALPAKRPAAVSFVAAKPVLHDLGSRVTRQWQVGPKYWQSMANAADERGKVLDAIAWSCWIDGTDAVDRQIREFDVFDLRAPPPSNPRKLAWKRDPPFHSGRMFAALHDCALAKGDFDRAHEWGTLASRILVNDGYTHVSMEWLEWLRARGDEQRPLPAQDEFYERAAQKMGTWAFIRNSDAVILHPAYMDLAARITLAKSDGEASAREASTWLLAAEYADPGKGYRMLAKQVAPANALDTELDASLTRLVKERKNERVSQRRAERHEAEARAKAASAATAQRIDAGAAPSPPAKERALGCATAGIAAPLDWVLLCWMLALRRIRRRPGFSSDGRDL